MTPRTCTSGLRLFRSATTFLGLLALVYPADLAAFPVAGTYGNALRRRHISGLNEGAGAVPAHPTCGKICHKGKFHERPLRRILASTQLPLTIFPVSPLRSSIRTFISRRDRVPSPRHPSFVSSLPRLSIDLCGPSHNVLQTGEICLDILKNAWSPAWTLQSVCRAIAALLACAEPDSPLVRLSAARPLSAHHLLPAAVSEK